MRHRHVWKLKFLYPHDAIRFQEALLILVPFIESYFSKVFSPFCSHPFSHEVTFVRAFSRSANVTQFLCYLFAFFVSRPFNPNRFPQLIHCSVIFKIFFLAIFCRLPFFPPLLFLDFTRSFAHDLAGYCSAI